MNKQFAKLHFINYDICFIWILYKKKKDPHVLMLHVRYFLLEALSRVTDFNW